MSAKCHWTKPLARQGAAASGMAVPAMAGRAPECLKRPPKHFTHTIREFARLPLAAHWLRDDNSK